MVCQVKDQLAAWPLRSTRECNMKTLFALFVLQVSAVCCLASDIGRSFAEIKQRHSGEEVVAFSKERIIVNSEFIGAPCQIGYSFKNNVVDEMLVAFKISDMGFDKVLDLYSKLIDEEVKAKRYDVDIKLRGVRLTRSFMVSRAVSTDYIIGDGRFDDNHSFNIFITFLSTNKPEGCLRPVEFRFSIIRASFEEADGIRNGGAKPRQ